MIELKTLLLVGALLSGSMQAQTSDQRIAALEAKAAAQAKEIAELRAAVDALKGKPTAAVAVPAVKREVKSWSGTGAKDTETFTTTVGEWTLRWQSASVVSITVYDADAKKPVSVASSAGGADSSVVRVKPGRYYLSVLGVGEAWKVSVEE